jgi:hypothetical protein
MRVPFMLPRAWLKNGLVPLVDALADILIEEGMAEHD